MTATLRTLIWSGVVLLSVSCSTIEPTDTSVSEGETKGRYPSSSSTSYGSSCYGRPDGYPCSDGDACTRTDVCYRGVCKGKDPVTCAAKDQCHAAGVCNKQTGVCSNPAKPDGTTCLDGNLCTQGDTCRAGKCQAGTPKTCAAAADQCHEAGACDPMTGACTVVAKADGTACDDGNACTQADACTGGKCQGGNPVTCAAADQCHVAGVCDPTSGACSNPPVADGTACSDGNACTQVDACVAGVCAGGSPVTCLGADQCHTGGVCDPATGVCTNVTLPDGTACSDGNACTRTDVCQAGACVGTDPVTCAAADQCHAGGVCDPTTGACSGGAPVADGTGCNDHNPCTQLDVCVAGACTGRNPVVCTASDQCHDAGTCDPTSGACSNPPRANGSTCDDGNACSRGDTCQAGACAPGAPVICTASDQCHDVGTCNPTSGACSNPAKDNGAKCDDGSACSRADTCQAGACVGGDPVVCPAADQCHDAGTCDPTSGACSNPAKADGVTCSDGNACSQTDTCQAGACVGGNPVLCPAADQCHDVGACDPSSGVCSNPAKVDGATCNDGNACSQTDTCQAGACVGGNPVVCPAADQCHDAGTCNPTSGVCSNPAKADGVKCDDGSACSQTDTCQAGACVGGNPVVCPAPDQCHDVGTCDPASGACSNPAKSNGTTCDDNNACTQTDTCVAGTCTGADPVTCGASDQCHLPGTCSPITGACSNPIKPSGATCDDGDACTTTDTCQLGRCTGQAVTCTALDQCHAVGVCDHGTGVCSNPPLDGTACDDGNLCTQTDLCKAGKCTGANPITCGPSDRCHVAGTCNPITGACFNPPAPNGTACSDGNACTQSDTCQGGACIGGPPVVCVAQGQCLAPGTCDPVTGSCSTATKPDGTACDDGDVCSDNDACKAGLCTAGSSACVSLSFKNITPVNKRLTVQLLGQLNENPMVAVPGDAVLFTSQVTNNGTLVEIANGEVDITNTVVPNPAFQNDGRFTVAGYQVSLEALSPAGLWSAVARFERDNDGKSVTPAAPVFPMQVFDPRLVQPPPPGVTPAPPPPLSPDQLFHAQINAGATGRWNYNFTTLLPPSGVQALFDPTKSRGVRVVLHFDTSVSKKPFDGTTPPGDLSPLLAGFTGTLLDPTSTITFAGLAGGGTLAAPGSTVPPGAVSVLSGSIPAPPFPPRGTGETDGAYTARLRNASYQVRARATGRVTSADPPTIDYGQTLGATVPIIAVTKTGATSAVAGQSARYTLSLRNNGTAAAGPFTIVDTVGGVSVPTMIVEASQSVGPGLTGSATFDVGVPVGVTSVTDIAQVTWRDRNGNLYGTIGSNPFSTTVTPPDPGADLTGQPALSLSDAEAQAATDLLRASVFGNGRLASMPGPATAGPATAGWMGSWTLPGSGLGAGAGLPGAATRTTGDARVGRIVVRAADVAVWAAGLPITVGRRYDSAGLGVATAGDFGNGWQLAMEPRLDVDAGQDVALAMGDGRRLPFSLGLAPYSNVMRALLQPVFVPGGGTIGTLTSDGCALVTVDDGRLTCFMGGGDDFAPTAYAYSEPGGRVFRMGGAGQPLSIADGAGTDLTFDASGVGQAGAAPLIRFNRDGLGRIAEVVVRDPMAGDRAYRYVYDDAGDLRAVVSPLGALLTEYTYDGAHRLTTVRDADGTTRAIGAEGASLTQAAATPVQAIDAGAGMSCVPGAAAGALLSRESAPFSEDRGVCQ